MDKEDKVSSKEGNGCWIHLEKEKAAAFIRYVGGVPVAMIQEDFVKETGEIYFLALYSKYTKENKVATITKKFSIPLEAILWIDAYLISIGFKQIKWPNISKLI